MIENFHYMNNYLFSVVANAPKSQNLQSFLLCPTYCKDDKNFFKYIDFTNLCTNVCGACEFDPRMCKYFSFAERETTSIVWDE
jgi:hypothetical protein